MLLKENTFVSKKYNAIYIAGLIGWLIAILADFFDSFAAGAYLDTNAVSAIELITPFQLVINFVASFFTYGQSIRYSQAIGADDKDKAYKIAGMSFIVAIIQSVVFYLVLVSAKDLILNSYSISKEVYDYADTYFKYNMLIALVLPIYYTIYYFVNYDGDASNVLISDAVVAIISMAFPYILVHSMGIKGIAITTPIAYAIGLFPLAFHFFSKRNSIHFKMFFNFKELFEGIKLASASMLPALYIAIVDIIFNAMIVKEYTDKYLPAYGVTNFVLNMANILVAPMSAAVILIACDYGEKNPYAIKRAFKLAMKHGVILSVVFTVAFVASSSYLPALYGIESGAIFEAGRFAAISIPIAFIGYMLCSNLMSYYAVVDKPLLANVVSASYFIIIPMLVAYPLGKYVGFNAMNIGFAIAPIVSIILMLVIFYLKKEIKDAPLFLPKSDEKEFSYNLELNKENIVELRDSAMNDLSKMNIKENIINEIGIVIEDTLMYIYRKNKKKVIGEVIILVSEEHIRLFIKDTGEIFDLIKEADDGLSIRAYTIERLTSSTYEKANSIALSFNRNIYSWNLKELGNN